MLKAQDETQVYIYQLIASAHHHTVTGMPKECLYHAPKTRNHRASVRKTRTAARYAASSSKWAAALSLGCDIVSGLDHYLCDGARRRVSAS